MVVGGVSLMALMWHCPSIGVKEAALPRQGDRKSTVSAIYRATTGTRAGRFFAFRAV
jgi:hypothetical protein